MDNRKSKRKVFFKIVIIGDSSVGKSCLIHRYVKSQYAKDFKPTIGAEFSNKEVLIDGKTVVSQIWDTAGQERYQSLSTSFYRGADWWAIVFDLTDRDSFENLSRWKRDFIKHCDPKDPNKYPFVVLGNKSDLKEDIAVNEDEVRKWWADNGDMEYVCTSAKDNIGVDVAFNKLIKQALENDTTGKLNLPEHIRISKANEDQRSGATTRDSQSRYKVKKKSCC